MCVCISVRFLDATHLYTGTRKTFLQFFDLLFNFFLNSF